MTDATDSTAQRLGAVVLDGKYSSKVIADGQKVVYVFAPTAHNGSNPNAAVGAMQVAPSQTKVLVSA